MMDGVNASPLSIVKTYGCIYHSAFFGSINSDSNKIHKILFQCYLIIYNLFFFKQKMAYDIRISDWSSDVCSSDLYAINPDWIKAGVRVPQGALLNSAFEGLGAEEICRRLGKEEKDKKGQAGKQPEGQQKPDAGQGGQQQAPGGQPGTGKPSGDPGKCGEIRDAAPDHAPAEIAAQEAEWKANVRQALAVAKAHNAGTLPGHLQAVDVATVAAKVDWRNELRRFIDQSVIRDYSWTRPNRPHIGRGVILPGFVADSLSHLIIVIEIGRAHV